LLHKYWLRAIANQFLDGDGLFNERRQTAVDSSLKWMGFLPQIAASLRRLAPPNPSAGRAGGWGSPAPQTTPSASVFSCRRIFLSSWSRRDLIREGTWRLAVITDAEGADRGIP
jgi:hypothetical protein